MHSRQNSSNLFRLRPLREFALPTDAIIISWHNAVKQKAGGKAVACGRWYVKAVGRKTKRLVDLHRNGITFDDRSVLIRLTVANRRRL